MNSAYARRRRIRFFARGACIDQCFEFSERHSRKARTPLLRSSKHTYFIERHECEASPTYNISVIASNHRAATTVFLPSTHRGRLVECFPTPLITTGARRQREPFPPSEQAQDMLVTANPRVRLSAWQFCGYCQSPARGGMSRDEANAWTVLLCMGMGYGYGYGMMPTSSHGYCGGIAASSWRYHHHHT